MEKKTGARPRAAEQAPVFEKNEIKFLPINKWLILENFGEYGIAAQGLDGEASVFVNHIRSRIVFFGQSDRARVQVKIGFSKLFAFENVSVAVEEYFAFAKGGRRIRVVVMSVGRKNGKTVKAVKGFTVAGNFFELLNSIEAVSNNVKYGMPSGFTVFGSPDVLLGEMSVAGV